MPLGSSRSTASRGFRAGRLRLDAGLLLAEQSSVVQKPCMALTNPRTRPALAASTRRRTLERLRQSGYEQRGIHGEVYLWGTVVEHKLGWRAQFAYPKSLFLPPDAIPVQTLPGSPLKVSDSRRS
jgi:hypothetical protein